MQNAKNSETFKTEDENCKERTLHVNGQREAFKIEPGQLVEIFFATRVPSRMVIS